jgi:hypothetical protein
MELKAVFSSMYIGEVYFVKTLLDSEGLESQIIDEHIASIAPHLSLTVQGPKIVVKTKDVPAAQEIIQGY